MPTYNTSVTRDAIVSMANADPLIPYPQSQSIIQELPTSSFALNRMRRIQLSSQTQRLPVLDVLPQAYFVTGDTGLKQTTTQDWKNVILTVEEIACIVPIAEAYLDDAMVPIWDEVRPRLVEAIGKLIDQAVLFGVNKPSTWGTDVYTAATGAGNNVVSGTTTDLATDVANLGKKLTLDGYSGTGFAAAPGFIWNLNTLRTSQGVPIYQPDLQGPVGGRLYGYTLNEVNNGSWDATKASLIFGDWSNAIIGVRQDITFKLFTEGVITDNGSPPQVILNLMQQDAVALRVVMRLAYQSVNPLTELNATSSTRSPFAVLGPVSGLS